MQRSCSNDFDCFDCENCAWASGKLQTLSCLCFVLEAKVVHRGGPEVRLASLCNDPLIISLFLFKWRKRAFIILLTWEITAANAPLKSKTEPRF